LLRAFLCQDGHPSLLIARAPLRISLAGGGTDLPAYYETHGGYVVSTSINKYIYVFVSPSTGRGVPISSSDYRAFSRHSAAEAPLWDGDLGLVKATLDEFGVVEGISLFLASEVPPGTGLGSSSTVAVALIKAISTFLNIRLNPGDVASYACRIEIDKLKSPIGKQDQYASAFGGLNAITFARDGVEVERLRVSPEVLAALERNLLLFFTGSTRSANTILRQQQQSSGDRGSQTVAALDAIQDAARATRKALESGDLRRFGAILAESWEQKKRLAPGVSNPRVDELYELARSRGAVGGKLAGAGGGGFLLLYCEQADQERVTAALEAAGLYQMDFHFERAGAQVLMNALARSTMFEALVHMPAATGLA
jgi:D-glycero-alpha-D-manno-heptose-7-phosphate kinase